MKNEDIDSDHAAQVLLMHLAAPIAGGLEANPQTGQWSAAEIAARAVDVACAVVNKVRAGALDTPVDDPFHIWCDWCDQDLGESDSRDSEAGKRDRERCRTHALECESNPHVPELRRLRERVAELERELDIAEHALQYPDS